ncbi:MAG: hypothetical protein JKX81_01250 [Arenicella sp.]|nr:hypothetical protein [Arenicella sp.]
MKLNTLYRGQSILTALSSADFENHQVIKALLISNRAHDNLGKLVRQTIGVKYKPQCKIGQPSIQQFATKPEYLSSINEAFDKGLRANNFEIFHASLLPSRGKVSLQRDALLSLGCYLCIDNARRNGLP